MKSADFLHNDLEGRIATRDIRFSLMALLGRPDDPTRTSRSDGRMRTAGKPYGSERS